MWPNPQFPADLVTFTEEILNGELHILCSFTSKIGNILSETLWTYGSKYSRTDQVKFMEDSLLKFKMIWSAFEKH